jgi:hypothetical protein
MGLSLFFVVERPASALLFARSGPSIAVHIATALVELVILVMAVRVWRLGHSAVSDDMAQILSLDPSAPPPAAPEEPEVKAAAPTSTLTPGTAWLIAGTTLALAAVLVADGLASGFTPGGRAWGVVGESSGWLVYLFAAVALTVATRAVKGGRLALRLLGITALIFFMERAFSPLALRVVDPLVLALHGLAALIAIAVALAAANAIRGSRPRSDPETPALETA